MAVSSAPPPTALVLHGKNSPRTVGGGVILMNDRTSTLLRNGDAVPLIFSRFVFYRDVMTRLQDGHDLHLSVWF